MSHNCNELEKYSCKHTNVRYCSHCKKVYCEKCDKTWGEGTSWFYPNQTTYTYQYPNPNDTTIWCSDNTKKRPD